MLPGAFMPGHRRPQRTRRPWSLLGALVQEASAGKEVGHEVFEPGELPLCLENGLDKIRGSGRETILQGSVVVLQVAWL